MKSSPLFLLFLAVSLQSLGCGSKSGDSGKGPSPADVGGSDDGTTSTANREGTNPGECSDGADNDGDGDFDCNDSDCAGSPDCSEANTPGGCSDGADNDQDGLFDCDDPDCVGDEACGDGIEGNDAGECEDGVDNDGDGLTDCEDDDCAGFEGCDDYEGDEPGECTDGEDNDNDGLTDCDDEGCAASPDCEGGAVGTEASPGTSCKDILDRGGSAGDRSYWIDPAGSGAFEVYCDMTTDGGGWTRVMNFTYDSAEDCPDGWYSNSSIVSACTGPGATVVDTYGIQYGEMYGGLTAYLYGNPDAFWGRSGESIYGNYVDGISITRDDGTERRHVFSYALTDRTGNNTANGCPADGGVAAPDFVGSDYLCGTANPSTTACSGWCTSAAFSSDQFQVNLESANANPIMVRILFNQDPADENVGIPEMYLFIR